VSVPESADSDTAQGVQIAVTVAIEKVRARSVIKCHRQWLVRVHQVFGHHVPQKQKAASSGLPGQIFEE